MCGGSGPSQTYSDVTQTTTTLPDYAQPYFEDLLARAGYETSLPYEAYGGQRLAYFSPLEQEAMAQFGEMGMRGDPAALGQASDMAANAAGLIDTGIATNTYQASPLDGAGQHDAMSRASDYVADERGAGYQADNRNVFYGVSTRDSEYRPGQRDMGYLAGQMGESGYYDGGYRDVGYQPGTLADSDVLAEYMNPYQQHVTDIRKREASRQADIRDANIGLESAGAGSLGGYREAIMRAENERNLMQELDDIQMEGSSAGFANAQQAFEQDRAAQAQLETFGQQQFGLNEQIKQRTAELMQQGFSAQEAARQAQEQFGQAQFSLNEQMQQAKEQLWQSQFGMNERNAQLLEQLQQSQFGLNEAGRQQMEQFIQSQFGLNESARQSAEQLAQSQFGMNMQDAQFASGLELQAWQAQEAARAQAAQLGLTADQINQAGQIAASQAMLQGSGIMANIAGQQQAMEMDRLAAMQQAGMAERSLMQQGLDIGYQDFLRQQAYPMEQIYGFSNVLHAMPVQPGQTTAAYGPEPSTLQQIGGGGLAAYALSQMYPRGG